MTLPFDLSVLGLILWMLPIYYVSIRLWHWMMIRVLDIRSVHQDPRLKKKLMLGVSYLFAPIVAAVAYGIWIMVLLWLGIFWPMLFRRPILLFGRFVRRFDEELVIRPSAPGSRLIDAP